MMATSIRYILGSRSPQRLELLRMIVPAAQIDVVPPESAAEPDFAGLENWLDIRDRLLRIARGKLQQVRARIAAAQRERSTIITADTAIVVQKSPRAGATPFTAPLLVLGQPPETDTWRDVVRHWFTDHYAGQTHIAATAVCVAFPDGRTDELVATTNVTMCSDVERWIDWYLDTGEPRGKAGGYALQGAGSVFVESVEGSLSNVIGLPLEAVMEMLAVGGTPA